MTDDTVIHVGTNKAKYAHRIPHDLLAICVEMSCEECGQATLFLKRSLDVVRGAVASVNRPLRLVCNNCGPDESQIAARIELLNKALSDKMLKHHADMN